MNRPVVIPPLPFPADFYDVDYEITEQDINVGPKLPKKNVRNLHRDQDYENYESLVSQKFDLMQDIKAIRKENQMYKKQLEQYEKQLAENVKEEIENCKILKMNQAEIERRERLQALLKQYKDLNVGLNELNAQMQLFCNIYNEFKERELKAYTGLQTNQKKMDQEELDEMDRVLRKAIDRLNGPVAEAQTRYLRMKEKITQRQKMLQNLYEEEQAIINEIEHFHDDEVLPEELEAELEKKKHELSVLRHRRYNREKELQNYIKQRRKQKVAAEEIKTKEAAAQRARQEREKFRRIMQTRRRNKRIEDEKRLLGKVISTDDGDDKWKMLTFVKEAKDEM